MSNSLNIPVLDAHTHSKAVIDLQSPRKCWEPSDSPLYAVMQGCVRLQHACTGRAVVQRMSFVQAPCATRWREECTMHILAGLWYTGCLVYRLLVQQGGEKVAAMPPIPG